MKISVPTDVLANRPALGAALRATEGEGCRVIHPGDAIGTGPSRPKVSTSCRALRTRAS